MICKYCIVAGRVQGVWYRDTIRRKALQLGLSGSAVNRPDGSVEVIACGADEAVVALHDALWKGSTLSHVRSVTCRDWDGTVGEGFRTG